MTILLSYRYLMIEHIVIKQITQQNKIVALTYQNNIWNKNQDIIKNINFHDDQKILRSKNFIQFTKSTIDFFLGVNAHIILYDNLGNQLLTNYEENIEAITLNKSVDIYYQLLIVLDKIFLSSYFATNPISKSLKGKEEHVLIPRSQIKDIAHKTYEKSYISSYIPVIYQENGKSQVQGIIQITTDITQQWDNITGFEKKIIIIFIIIFTIFFIIIVYNTHHAQRIINQQYKTNRELKIAKTLAETESSAKTQFLANISHELRTPLNAIIGFSEIIIAKTYGEIRNKQYNEYIHDINNSGKHLLSVINDILDFSKISADKLVIDNVDLDLNKLISSTVRLVKTRAEEAGINLIETLPDEHIIIAADPKRFKQALLNILSNAIKFTPVDGSITISLTKDPIGKLVYIIIKDTGIGLKEEDIPKALSSFGQIDNKLNKQYDGTGLGLPLTKKLIELMNGQIEIQSKVGKGTKITITFTYNDSITLS